MRKIYNQIKDFAIDVRVAYELDPGRFAIITAVAAVVLLIGLVVVF